MELGPAELSLRFGKVTPTAVHSRTGPQQDTEPFFLCFQEETHGCPGRRGIRGHPVPPLPPAALEPGRAEWKFVSLGE